jgi:hypothetical protein
MTAERLAVWSMDDAQPERLATVARCSGHAERGAGTGLNSHI